MQLAHWPENSFGVRVIFFFPRGHVLFRNRKVGRCIKCLPQMQTDLLGNYQSLRQHAGSPL
jgi:hypothetical protein